MHRQALVGLFLAALATPAVADTNLITNGGFETGNLTGWTLDPFAAGNTQVSVYSGSYCCQGATPPEGTFAAAFGGGGNVTGEIAQVFPTVSGTTYTGSLQYAGVGGANDGSVNVTLTNASTNAVLSSSGPIEPAFNGTFSTYNFSFVASSSFTRIDLLVPNGGGTDYNIDNVIVPEPASLGLLGLGAVGLLARRKR